MDRQDVFHHIDRDKDLKEEILTRISEDPDLGWRLQAKAQRVSASRPQETEFELAPAGTPPPLTADRARDVLEHPTPVPADPGMEAIILTLGRPVLIVRDDDFIVDDEDTETWRERLEPARAALRAAIPVRRPRRTGQPPAPALGRHRLGGRRRHHRDQPARRRAVRPPHR